MTRIISRVAVAAVAISFTAAAFAADFAPTPGSVAASSQAKKTTGVAGETITAGMVLYVSTDGKLYKADANAAGATTVAGIALHNASANQPLTYATEDLGGINLGNTLDVGQQYVLSDTAGLLKPASDWDVGDYVTVICVAKTASACVMRPLPGGAAAVATPGG